MLLVWLRRTNWVYTCSNDDQGIVYQDCKFHDSRVKVLIHVRQTENALYLFKIFLLLGKYYTKYGIHYVMHIVNMNHFVKNLIIYSWESDYTCTYTCSYDVQGWVYQNCKIRGPRDDKVLVNILVIQRTLLISLKNLLLFHSILGHRADLLVMMSKEFDDPESLWSRMI